MILWQQKDTISDLSLGRRRRIPEKPTKNGDRPFLIILRRCE
jgi:hypothetical protein